MAYISLRVRDVNLFHNLEDALRSHSSAYTKPLQIICVIQTVYVLAVSVLSN